MRSPVDFRNEALWRHSERYRRERVLLELRCVVANAHRGGDERLVAWAEAEGRAVWIDRTRGRPINLGGWGNPFIEGRDGNRLQVCEKFEQALRGNREWLARVPELHGGKVLICWCHPQRCHGDLLARLANEGLSVPWPRMTAD